MLDIQWALVRLAAISGIADAVDKGYYTDMDVAQPYQDYNLSEEK
jgi:hypothetical protein